MKTIEDVVLLAKRLLAEHGGLEPTLLIEGSAGSRAFPLPDAEEAIKFSLLEALGFALARENRIGELRQLFLVAEGWRSHRPHVPGLPMTQPKHAPDRVDVPMVAHRREPEGTTAMVLSDVVRDGSGEPAALKTGAQPGDGTDVVASPPLDAIVRGFRRGRADTPDRIRHEPNDPDAWVCRCGNTPATAGFRPCDRRGNAVAPTAADWPEPLYRCDRCGRIVDARTLIVVGRRCTEEDPA